MHGHSMHGHIAFVKTSVQSAEAFSSVVLVTTHHILLVLV